MAHCRDGEHCQVQKVEARFVQGDGEMRGSRAFRCQFVLLAEEDDEKCAGAMCFSNQFSRLSHSSGG